MSLFFEIYMGMLEPSAASAGASLSTDQEKVIESAYKELGTLVSDLLEVLVSEQDSDNYEANFFEVWTRIFKTLAYLIQHRLIGSDLVNLFVTRFFDLKASH